MTQFFKKFPVINYANNNAINLLSRVTMSKLALSTTQAYYDYIIPDGTRPDNLSFNYYDNPDYVWLIGLTNKIVDPYYDFPISDDNINTLVIKKYGSIAKANEKILYFQNNWATDESNISTNAFAALSVGQQKYWAPEINEKNTIISYVRKQEDWIVTTNKVQNLSYAYSVVDNEFVNVLTEDNYEIMTEDDFNIIVDYIPETVTDKKFVAGELISQDGVTIATVVTASETTLVIQHIATVTAVFNLSTEDNYEIMTEDDFNISVDYNPTGEITGLTSGASGVVSLVTTLNQNIPSTELIYWRAVTAYDYEIDLNAKRRNIKLLDNKYAEQATKELKTLLLI